MSELKETSRTAGRVRGMLDGLAIGDALAMPVHWYYDPGALAAHYGEVRDFLEPRNPHPFSILWRSRYHALNARGEILHEQARYWGQRDVHYHQFLRAGENTVTAQLAALLWDCLNERCGWDPQAFLERYITFMTTPGTHRDTYLEECHRNFFANYARGHAPDECATPEKHVGGLVGLFPVLAYYDDDPDTGIACALERMRLTHPGPRMEEAAVVLIEVYRLLREGFTPAAAADAVIARQGSPLLAGEWSQWLKQPARTVLNRRIGTVCYNESAVPAVLYLLLRHGDEPETALIENTMAGGDNVHRGAVLGALLGYAHGHAAWPARWREGLLRRMPTQD
jgi:ADP-ribosylglycohydrolase